MGLRGWLNRLERGASGDLDSFRLRDDPTYYYDRLETSKELYCHAYDVQLGDADKWPEPPEIYRKIAEATDPAGALAQLEEQLTPGNPEMRFVQPSELFDTRALVNERRLVPIHHAPPEDLLSG